jgi:N-acetylglutamate synthase-like GNAT family acetyltransferase
MKIIKASILDARKISSLIINTIKKVNSKDYHPKHLQHELSCNTFSKIKEHIKNNFVFIAIEGDNIIGVVILDADNATITSLYIKESYIGRGIGKKLMEYIEQKAKKLGVRELKLYPTKFAENFYKRIGYKIKGKFIGTLNGGFPVTDMRKKI